MNSEVSRWQHKLDARFPLGVIASWDADDDVIYLIPRLEVTGMAGLDPMVRMAVFSGSDKVLGPWQVTSYQDHQKQPYMARVQFGDGEAMFWNAGVGDRLANAMAKDRARSLDRYPDGGPLVLHGEEVSGEGTGLSLLPGHRGSVPATAQGRGSAVSCGPGLQCPGPSRIRPGGRAGTQGELEPALPGARGIRPVCRPVVGRGGAGRHDATGSAAPGA